MGISQAAADALFLGDRVSNLVARIKALGKLVDMPMWFSEEAVPWATRVDSAIKARDSLLHRPPVMLVKSDDDGDGVLGWSRARRDHQLIPVDNGHLLDVIERLANLEGQAKMKLCWGWNTSVTLTDTGDNAGADGDPADCPPCD